MDAVLMTKLRVSERGNKSRRITAVAAYEDSCTDTRVSEFCNSLSTQLGPRCKLVKQMWMLSELRVPQLRTIAATEAAAADLVIIAVHHSESLPDELQSWIELWVGQKGRQPELLLALFDPVYTGVSASLRTYLEGVARKGRMEFVVQAEERPEEL
jgi:hypothetical protein